MYYFYVLQSDADNGYYYGSTVNLKRRIAEHTDGRVDSTSYRRPLKLVYYEAYRLYQLHESVSSRLRIAVVSERVFTGESIFKQLPVNC